MNSSAMIPHRTPPQCRVIHACSCKTTDCTEILLQETRWFVYNYLCRRFKCNHCVCYYDFLETVYEINVTCTLVVSLLSLSCCCVMHYYITLLARIVLYMSKFATTTKNKPKTPKKIVSLLPKHTRLSEFSAVTWLYLFDSRDYPSLGDTP